MNASQLVCPFKFQRDGVAKVNKFFYVNLRQPTNQIPDKDKPQAYDDGFHYLLRRILE